MNVCQRKNRVQTRMMGRSEGTGDVALPRGPASRPWSPSMAQTWGDTHPPTLCVCQSRGAARLAPGRDRDSHPNSFLTRPQEWTGPKAMGETRSVPGASRSSCGGRVYGYAGEVVLPAGWHHCDLLYSIGWPGQQIFILVLICVTHDDFVF